MDENSAFDDPDEPSTSTGITRKRVSDGPEIVLGEKGEFPNFGHYMDAKVQKLMHQVHSNVTKKSDLFNGISIFVNGYTLPPAAELKKIVVENGGEYHHYYKLGRTTYMIAMNLAKSKLDSLRKEEIVVHPKWIMNSLQQGLLLPIHPYLLTKQLELTQNVLRTHANPETSASRFYERSRLHLISTLAQEMKEYIAELRSKMDTHEFVSRSKLCHLSGSKGDHSAFICHLDMDCFFVSIGLRMRPDLVGKPLVITHSRSASDHGKAEIASCSYEARKFNIKNGMWISDAYNLCPDLVCLPYQFEEYRASSKRLYSIVSKYTLDIKAVSCDEMYVDLSGLCEELQIGDVMGVVNEIRKEIFDELNCNASAGIGPNMLIARLATKKAKPNGQFMVTSSEVSNFIRPVAIKDLPGVGYSSLHKIKEAFGNMMTCEELQSVFCSTLQALFGTKLGAKIFYSCRGQGEEMEFTDTAARKSVSCDMNFGIRANNFEELDKFMQGITEELSKRLERTKLAGTQLTLRLLIRMPDAPLEPEKYGAHGPCDQVSKSVNLAYPTFSKELIHQAAMRLAKQLKPVPSDVRGIGLTMTKLSKKPENAQKGGLYNYLLILKKGSQFQESDKPKNEPGVTFARPALPKPIQLKTKKKGPKLPPVCAKQRDWRPRKVNTLPKPPPARKCIFDDKFVLDGYEVYFGKFRFTVRNPPSEEIISDLTEAFKILIDRGDFRKVKLTWSYLEQVLEKYRVKIQCLDRGLDESVGWLADICLIYSGWESALTVLKHTINEYCKKKEGSVLFPLVLPISKEEETEIRRCWDKKETPLYDGFKVNNPVLQAPFMEEKEWKDGHSFDNELELTIDWFTEKGPKGKPIKAQEPEIVLQGNKDDAVSKKEEPTSCFDLEDYIKETKKEELRKSKMKDDLKNSSCDEEKPATKLVSINTKLTQTSGNSKEIPESKLDSYEELEKLRYTSCSSPDLFESSQEEISSTLTTENKLSCNRSLSPLLFSDEE